MTMAHFRAAAKRQSPRAGTTVQGLGKREAAEQAGFRACAEEDGRLGAAGQKGPG